MRSRYPGHEPATAQDLWQAAELLFWVRWEPEATRVQLHELAKRLSVRAELLDAQTQADHAAAVAERAARLVRPRLFEVGSDRSAS